MLTVFEKEYTLRANDFDRYNRIKPSALLDLFQDAAGRHSRLLGVGIEEMLERGYLWVLVKVQYRLLAPFDRYHPVTVKTWPLKPERLTYRREYEITSEDGRRLAAGSSEWVIIDRASRKLASVPNLYPITDGFCEDIVMPEKRFKKIHAPENCDNAYRVKPGFCELDMNNHVNNTKYADFVLDALSPSKSDTIVFFQTEYRREVLYGTELEISFSESGDEITFAGKSSGGDIMFLCRAVCDRT